MYKQALAYELLKLATKQQEVYVPELTPVGKISAKNQGIDPELVRIDPGKATDQLMARFLAGKIKKYDPDKDPIWQSMIGKSAGAVGGDALELANMQEAVQDKKSLEVLQANLPQTSTGLWARQHNGENGNIHSPFQAAEYYNKLTHMTHQEDLMPGAGSRSQSLNTRQNINNVNPNYGAGRGQGQYYDRFAGYRSTR